jgi:hypothetical protein
MMPDKSAAGIIEYEPERQLRILSVACPNRYEKIWDILDKNHLIEMHISSPGYGVFSDFDCAFVQKHFQ